MSLDDHIEDHFVTRTGWLRAAILGANDGIVSTASLLVGVIAAEASHGNVVLAGLAGLTAGAFSMAAGEYVSVSAQADTEAADLEREAQALVDMPEAELRELAQTFEARGVTAETALQVAKELSDHDALDAHAREELGLSEVNAANPLQAAWASALSFSAGAALPLAGAVFVPGQAGVAVVAGGTLSALALLGAIGARTGGAPIWPGVRRVLLWSSLAMAVTYVVGLIFGIAV